MHGAHIFHTDHLDVWNYVNRFTKFNAYIHTPLANYKGTLYHLPFNMNTFAKMWNITEPEDAKRMIEKQKRESGITNPKNLEEQAIHMVGKDIYETLIKGYTEKQWGMDAKDLPASIIKRLPVRYTYNNNYFNHKYQGIPDQGYSKMIENMLSGIEVRLESDYFDKKSYYDELADKVVFTGPIDKFYDYCFGPLSYRSLRFETEILDKDYFQKCSVVNYTQRDVPYTRIIEHKHFNLKPNQKKTIITKEYPQDWNFDREPYYPINNDKNNALYEKYKSLGASNPNIIFGGRLAEYRYYDMDQVIDSALTLAKKEKSSF